MSTRKDSQASAELLVMQSSVPPTMARSMRPARIKCAPIPIAWVAEAQALATAKQGPVAPKRMLTWEGLELGMRRGTVKGSGRPC